MPLNPSLHIRRSFTRLESRRDGTPFHLAGSHETTNNSSVTPLAIQRTKQNCLNHTNVSMNFTKPKCDRITLIIDKMQQNKTNLCLNLIVDHQLTCKTASISSSSLGRVHIHQIHTRASKPYPKRRKPAHAACSQRTPTKRTSKLANATCPSATLSNCIQYNSSPTKDKTKCANGPLCTTHDNGTTKIDTK